MSFFASIQPLGVLSRQNRSPAKASNQTFVGMAAILRRDRECRQAALSLIRSGDAKAQLLVQALGSACGRDSQEALNRLTLDAPAGDPLRPTFLRSLSDSFEPIPETVDTHVALLDDPEIGEQAHVGLGKLIHTLVRHHEWEPARRSLDEILERLRTAPDDERRIRCLRALAFAGHPAAEDSIRPYLTHDDAPIRQEAVGALQRIPGNSVDLSLVGKALADGCQEVRKRAVAILGQRPPSSIVTQGLHRVASTDPVPELRRQAAFMTTALDPAALEPAAEPTRLPAS